MCCIDIRCVEKKIRKIKIHLEAMLCGCFVESLLVQMSKDGLLASKISPRLSSVSSWSEAEASVSPPPTARAKACRV